MNNQVFSDVLVFKTDIDSENRIEKIASLLNEDQRIQKWNIDRDDSENILRIESDDHNPDSIIELVTKAGFLCEELPD